MILSYKLCIDILLEPVKVDIKRTQTKNKTVRNDSNDKIQFTFFCLPDFFCSTVLYTDTYEMKSLGSAYLNIFLRVGRVTGNRATFFGLIYHRLCPFTYISL